MSETEVKVPNIGDFKDVEVIEVLVSEGQILKKNDPLITIESDKSSVEIPSNFEGKIKSLRTKVGDKVSEGALILILDSKSQLNERAEDKNWAYALGSEEMTDAFGADRSPSIVIIDKDGMITFSESGAMTESELEEQINLALA